MSPYGKCILGLLLELCYLLHHFLKGSINGVSFWFWFYIFYVIYYINREHNVNMQDIPKNYNNGVIKNIRGTQRNLQ